MKFIHTDNVLDTVKPTRLLQRIIQLGTRPNDGDIVLDFFAASASTAHAVLKQNREDGGNRRFISVQIAEPLPTPEEGLKTILDIGLERVENVAKRFKEQPRTGPTQSETEANEDLGFRLFKLAGSNLRAWSPPEATDPESYANQMSFYDDVLRHGWQAFDVVFEVALKEGYSLSSRVKREEQVTTNTVYRVADPERDQAFHICLDEAIDLESIRALGLGSEDLFVCRDCSLTDSLAANLALQCRLLTI